VDSIFLLLFPNLVDASDVASLVWKLSS